VPATPDVPHHGDVATGDPWLDLLGRLFLQACSLDEGWAPTAWNGGATGDWLSEAPRAITDAIYRLPEPQLRQLLAAPEWV